VEQDNQDRIVSRTQQQLQAMQNVTIVVAREIDNTHYHLSGLLTEPGRDPYQQRFLQEHVATLFNSFTYSAHNLHGRAISDIIADRQPEPQVVRVEKVYVPAPRKPLLNRLIGG
jgi:hypothetical protein